MYILLNMSKKLEGFELYRNSFITLTKDYSLDIIDLHKSIDSVYMDFKDFKNKVEDSLVKARASKYSLIVLYDFDMQKREPIAYSITGILNNLENQVIKELNHSYSLENIYFITLDDVERNYDGQLIDKSLEDSVNFDKKGILEDTDILYFFTVKDINFIENGLINLINKYKFENKLSEYDKIFDDLENNYLKNLEDRIVNSLQKEINLNTLWYENKVRTIFYEYKKGIKNILADISDGRISVEKIPFTFQSMIISSISSYSNINQNKIFRLNMLDNKGKYCRDEAKYRSYYKIISFVNYLVTEDKKYMFGNAYNINENHYTINVNVENSKIEKMLALYYSNLNFELTKLGEVKFSDIQVEEYAYEPLEVSIENNKQYIDKKPHFTLLKNDINFLDSKEYAKSLWKRYTDYVSYCNQRLRKYTDKLRVSMHKNISNRKKTSVSFNQLTRIIEEKNEKAKELKQKIASNTPNDNIQIDFQILDKHEKYVNKANKILNKRISLRHFLFNILIILFCSFIILPLTRRFDSNFVGKVIKLSMIITPMFFYIIVQLLFCYIKVRDANKIMEDLELYTKEKMTNIRRDDNKFKAYVNYIYELMMLTKYIDRLYVNANSANIDIENYRYHRGEIEVALHDVSTLATFLKVNIKQQYKEQIQIPIDINKSVEDNPAYCPLSFIFDNPNKYILKNNQQQETLKNGLLNLVENIKFDYDEVYDENFR